jgi:hypothetical protein
VAAAAVAAPVLPAQVAQVVEAQDQTATRPQLAVPQTQAAAAEVAELQQAE